MRCCCRIMQLLARSVQQDRVHRRRRRRRWRSARSNLARSSTAYASSSRVCNAGDRVVIEGLARARPGQKAKAEEGKIEAERSIIRKYSGPDQRRHRCDFHFFVDRPIFAAVLSVILTLLGAIPYPRASNHRVSGDRTAYSRGHGRFLRRSAKVLAGTVASPIEQESTASTTSLYRRSRSATARLTIDAVFKPAHQISIRRRPCRTACQLQSHISQIRCRNSA